MLAFTKLRSTGARHPTVSQLRLMLVSCGVVLSFPLLHDELSLGNGGNTMAALVFMVGAPDGIPALEQRTQESHGLLTRGNRLASHANTHNCLLHEEDAAEFRCRAWVKRLAFVCLAHLLMQLLALLFFYFRVRIVALFCW